MSKTCLYKISHDFTWHIEVLDYTDELMTSQTEFACFTTALHHKFTCIAKLQILSKGRFKKKRKGLEILELKPSFKKRWTTTYCTLLPINVNMYSHYLYCDGSTSLLGFFFFIILFVIIFLVIPLFNFTYFSHNLSMFWCSEMLRDVRNVPCSWFHWPPC